MSSEEFEALILKWRNAARDLRLARFDGEFADGQISQSRAFDKCADELEAALSHTVPVRD